MPKPLESARLKLERAEENIQSFNQHMGRFRESEPYRVTRELDEDGREHVYRVEVLRKSPLYLGTIVGDVFHNVRSALDSIVWDLPLPALPTLSDGQKRRIGFPIHRRRKQFKISGAKHVPDPAKDEIERVQPFYGWDLPPEAAPYSDDFIERMVADHPLSVIQLFNNMDKHRSVQVIPRLMFGSMRKDHPDLEHETHHGFGSFQSGELARFVFSQSQPDVDLEFHPMLDVSLSGSQTPVNIELERIVEHVRTQVVPRFEQFF